MTFVLQEVIEKLEASRSLELLKKLKKENFAKVAAHFLITPNGSATKSHILDLIENEIIDEVEETPTAKTAKF